MATEKQINYLKSLIDNKRIGEHAWVLSFWNAVESSAIANETVSALIDWVKYANNSNMAKLFTIVTLDANMQALGKLIASRASIEMMVEDGLTLEMVPGFVAQYVEETEIGIVPLRGFGNKVDEFVAAFVPVATVAETTYEITTDLIESEPATLAQIRAMSFEYDGWMIEIETSGSEVRAYAHRDGSDDNTPSRYSDWTMVTPNYGYLVIGHEVINA
jgi:hypothetical protein